MVLPQEKSTSEPVATEPPPAPEGDIFIDDTTSPEVLEAERQFFEKGAVEGAEEGAPEAAEEGAGEPAEAAPAAETPPTTPKPPATKPEPTAPATPPTGFRSEDDFRALQGALDKQTLALTEQNVELRQQATDARLETRVEAHRRDLAAFYEQQHIDPSQAATQIQSQTEEFRNSLNAQSQAEQLQSQMGQTNARAEATAKLTIARQFATQNELGNDQLQTLMAIDDPNAMGVVAKTLGDALKTQATAKKQATVPAGGENNQLETGQSASAPLSGHDGLVSSARAKAPHTWSPDEREAMRIQTHGQ